MSCIDAYCALQARVGIQTVDAVPLVVRGGLAAALAWSFVLVVLGMRTLRDTDGLPGSSAMSVSSMTTSPTTPTSGLAHRIAMILLAVSAMTTIGLQPAVAQATTARSAGPDLGRPSPQPPVPGFSGLPAPSLTSTPEPSFGASPCVPAPGWTASAPARTRHSGSASASLVTGCDGRNSGSPDVVVRRGDSLWTLVARHLRTEDPGLIAAEWPRWYATNRQTIGPDPDLLLVGQILHLPVSTDAGPDLQGLPR